MSTGTLSTTINATSQYWRDRLWLVVDDTGTLCEPNEHVFYPFHDELGFEIGVHCCQRCGNIVIENELP